LVEVHKKGPQLLGWRKLGAQSKGGRQKRRGEHSKGRHGRKRDKKRAKWGTHLRVMSYGMATHTTNNSNPRAKVRWDKEEKRKERVKNWPEKMTIAGSLKISGGLASPSHQMRSKK